MKKSDLGDVHNTTGEIHTEDMEIRHVLEKQFVQPLIGTIPSVLNRKLFELTNTAPLTITDFAEGALGQRIYILGDGFTTIANNATIKTNTAADKLLAVDKVYTFTFFGVANSHKWVEDVDESGGGGGSSGRENPVDDVVGTEFDYTSSPTADTTTIPSGSSWFNQGGTTFLEKYRTARLIIPGSGTTNNFRGLIWPVTSATLIRLQAKINIAARNVNDQICGLVIRETSSGRLLIFGKHNNGSYYIQRWNSVTSWNANSVGPITLAYPAFYLEVVRSGTSFTFNTSIDGRGYTFIGSHSAAGWMTTFDEVGFGGYSSPAFSPVITLEWLRVFGS